MNRRRYKEKTYYNRLPIEYQEVEYLEGGSSAAYLVIDYNIDSTCGISVDFKWPVDNYGAIFASNTNGIRGTRIGGSHANTGSYLYNYFNAAFSFSTKDEYAAKKNVKLNYENDGLLTVDTYGYDLISIQTPSNIDTDNAFQLFVNIYNQTNFGWSPRGQFIYDFKLTRLDELVMHLIPCYRKSDNKPGMYDIVNNKFYTNAGTGEFIVGQNIEPGCDLPGELGPDNPMKAKFVGYKKISELPSEYQTVEYLESTSVDQYIKTNILYSQMFDYYLGLESFTFTSGYRILYSETGISGWLVINMNQGIWRGYDFKSYTSTPSMTKGNYAFLASSSQVLKDGQPYGNTSADSGNTFGGNICLLKGIMKISYLRVVDRGNTIMHLIPCYRKSDNKPGIYDMVNNVFYTNAGTGDFLVGPDVLGKIIVERLWDYKRGIYNPETGEFIKY